MPAPTVTCVGGFVQPKTRAAAARQRIGLHQVMARRSAEFRLGNVGSDNLLPQPCDRLQIALVLASEAKYEVRAAGLHVFIEPLGDARRRAGVAHLALAHLRRRLAVISLEKTVEPV